jgi:hypothetical protein
MINITSMVMEATDDNPGKFNKLVISQGCYGKVREAVLNNQFNMPESLWWQVLAEQAAEPYPNTDTLLTPANHYMALGFCLGLLKPLYPAQPMDVDVDAVEKRTGEFGEVAVHGDLADFADGHVALRGWVHGGDEHEAGGEPDRAVGTSDGDDVVFEGLAEGFEGVAGELGEFVEEEDAAVGEGDLAGAGNCPTTDDGGGARGVVRRADGACGDEALAGGEHSGGGIDAGDLDGFVGGERREHCG